MSLQGVGARIASIVLLIRELGSSIGERFGDGMADVLARLRLEVRRAAAAFALALCAALLSCAALGFAACALVLALGEAHRMLAFGLLAGIFALLATVAALLLRRHTAP